MFRIKYILFLFVSALMFSLLSCSDSDGGGNTDNPVRRTIIVYMAADNNLSQSSTSYACQTDVGEIVEGSKNLSSDCKLVVYVDTYGSKPYIAEVSNGEKTIIKTYTTETSTASSESMQEVLQYIIDAYPANSYGIVFWGHGTGSIIVNDTIPVDNWSNSLNIAYEKEPNSYGADITGGLKWMNVPTLAYTLRQLHDRDGSKITMDYILFDACLMQSAEMVYELRNNARYIIGATCETPSFGANYEKLVATLGVNVDDIPKRVIDAYMDGTDWSQYQFSGVCLSAVDTRKLEDFLLATRKALLTLATGEQVELSLVPKESTCVPPAVSCIYYFKVNNDLVGHSYGNPIFYDINDALKANLTDAAYDDWYEVFDKTVVYARCPEDIRTTGKADWIGKYYGSPLTNSNFMSFYLPSTNYKCLSFLIPLSIYANTYPCVNKTMYDYEWCRKVGWERLGWTK